MLICFKEYIALVCNELLMDYSCCFKTQVWDIFTKSDAIYVRDTMYLIFSMHPVFMNGQEPYCLE